MGTRTLEARLRTRLLFLAVPALGLVAFVAVAATATLLESTDSATARAHAAELRKMFHRELDENDSPEKVLSELRSGIEPAGMRLDVLLGGEALHAGGAPISPPALSRLTPGTCATEEDAAGRYWRGCAVGDHAETVIAALSVDGHRGAVTLLAEVLGGVVLTVLAGLVLSLRSAVRAPLAELEGLVTWAKRPLEQRGSTPPSPETREIRELGQAFDALVRRLLDALARERANSAHIAHELRTPLTAIVAELEAMDPGSDGDRDRLARMRDDVARLSNAIDAILVLADGTGRVRSDTVVNVADMVRSLAPDATRIEAPDEALVEGDERLLGMAVQNLLENAQRYAGGARTIRLSREAELLRVSVIDTGPGLDDLARSRMFERYFRASADGEGKGLGLAFVRAVAERHGGRAEARPGPDERGLEVSMLLGPVAGWHDAPPARDASPAVPLS